MDPLILVPVHDEMAPWGPFSRTLEEEVAKRMTIQSLHFWSKPSSRGTSSKYGQFMKSKAFEILGFIKSVRCFVRCSSLTTFWTYEKLTCIHLFFTNAL